MPQDTASKLQARPIPVPSAAPESPPVTTMLMILALIMVTLYVGRDLLVPIALAVLLSFVLAPLVSRLRRWRVPRVPAVAAVVALLFVVIAGFGLMVGTQIADLAGNAPTYERNIRQKIQSLEGAGQGGGLVSRVSSMVRHLRSDIQQAASPEKPPSPGVNPDTPPAQTPVLVRVEDDASPVEVLGNYLGPVLAPLATLGMVLVFTLFILLQREDLRDRFIRLAGSGDLSRTTVAMNDAGKRVSRYLLMQVVVNALFGIPVGIGLWLIGVPNPALWGLLAFVLRFVPFAGPVIAVSFPLLLSIAVDPGWTMPLLTAGLFVVLELFSNNVVEPWLYGPATGMSAVAIIVSAVFWTTLWGPVGLLLATPLTVCLVVLGRHVPQLHFLEVMFGDRPVLPDEAKVYQRLLAGDPEEAIEICEATLEQGEFPALLDRVLLPALSLAEQDRQRGTLLPEGRHAVATGMAALLESLGDLGASATSPGTGRILCIAGRNELDEAAARLLSERLRRDGADAPVIACAELSPRHIDRLDAAGVRAAAVSYLNPSALSHARRTVARLRRRLGPGVPILLCLWEAHPEADAPRRATAETAADRVATNIGAAVEQLEELGGAVTLNAAE
ncbi:AI-2E family transporter [Azospirillum sp. RWY-5-1]|uniref:AI-2E family transporter n=1 Tax=Azospirillum oleiclasticum TaxID=2735135 RepID=A0ABX2T5Q7_9PROT|nr:AI-2E family transporter [Azospirillum oleiclasticum]NYZ12247.1 AI-2E family transporter [Azospirillum oleiclasticum]NYZ19407.1 AI-2E family transporter [Azospirillum oleiclasticum]